jgi:homoserine O-acetyltransferase/O-succinyltransferase
LVFAPGFFRDREFVRLGATSAEDAMRLFEGFFRRLDANDLLATLWTWRHADIAANERFGGDIVAALRAIEARAIVLPSERDALFDPGDSAIEVEHMPNAELRVIPSSWGHLAGYGANPPDSEVVDAALRELLDTAPTTPTGDAAGTRA